MKRTRVSLAVQLASISIITLATVPSLSAQDLFLEEIIVTAQKKSESLAEIPMTVNVVTGEQFSELGSFDFRDLDRMVAGISVGGQNFDVNIAVRGLGTNLNAATSPRVTIYWDGAYSAQQRSTFVSQFDLARFELLRGPQGTLYGKSSPAGALTVQTRNPNMEEFDGYIQQAFTERDGSNTQLAASIPIIPNELAVRVSGVYDENRLQDVHNLTLNKDNSERTTGGRLVVAWDPSDKFQLRFSYNYVEAEKDIDSIVEGEGLHYSDRIALNEFVATASERHRHAVLEMNYTLANGWLLTSVTSNQESLIERLFDSDHSPVVGQNSLVISNVDEIYSQEFRLQSDGNNDFWDWTAGVFYQDTAGDTPVFVDDFRMVGNPAPAYLPIVTEISGPSINKSKDWSVFLHNAFHVNDSDTVTLGIRYNNIERFNEQTFQQNTFLLFGEDRVGPVNESTVEAIPKHLQTLDYDAITGTLKYQRIFDDSLMVYASYDRGWRSGGVNIAARPIPSVWSDFDEETSDNFEVGVKWQFMDGRGLINTAVYYQTYTDFHYGSQNISYVLDDGSIGQNGAVVNADEVVSAGLEIELNYLLTENWNMTASMSYNNTEFEDFDEAPCNDEDQVLMNPGDFATCNLKGDPAGTLPQWSGVVISEYALPFSSGMEWYLRGLYKVEGERWDPDVNKNLSGYATLDLFTGFRSDDGNWDVSLWGKNLFDREARLDTSPTLDVPDYSVAGTPPTNSFAVIDTGLTRIENLLQPRTIGVTARYSF